MKNSKLHTTEDKSNEKVTSSNSKSEDTVSIGVLKTMIILSTLFGMAIGLWTAVIIFKIIEALV